MVNYFYCYFLQVFYWAKEYLRMWITLFLQSVLVSVASNIHEPLSISCIFIFGSSVSFQTRNLWLFCLETYIPEFFATKVAHEMSILHIQEIYFSLMLIISFSALEASLIVNFK